MLNFLRDPLREIEEPYFSLDEVSPPFLSSERINGAEQEHWPPSLATKQLVFSDNPMPLCYNLPLLLLQFVTFLFSKENSVWNSQLDAVYPDTMNNPLSHYWISSSHNT